MVFQLIRWVDLRRSLSTRRILKNMMLLLLQIDRLLHLQATLLKSVRLHPHRGQQLARSQGWDCKPPQKSVHKKLCRGQGEKLDGATKKVGRLCVHVWHLLCLPPFLPANSRSRQAEAKIFTIMCVTQKKPKVLCTLLSKQGQPLHVPTILRYSRVSDPLPINLGIKHQIENFQNIKVIRKVRKRRHENPCLVTQGMRFQKTGKKTVHQASTGHETQFSNKFGAKLSFPVLAFLECLQPIIAAALCICLYNILGWSSFFIHSSYRPSRHSSISPSIQGKEGESAGLS